MRVLVVHEHVPEESMCPGKGDLRFIMVAKTDTMSMVSPVVTYEGQAAYCNGNPYLVYGAACAEFTGLDKFDLNIDVAGIHSGNLEGWS